MFNNSNKELGRAFAAIATADSQMRGRSGILGLLMPTPRKVLMVGGAGTMALNSVDPECSGRSDRRSRRPRRRSRSTTS